MFIFNIKLLGVELLTLGRCLKHDRSLCASLFVVHKITSELEHTILAILYYIGAENIDKLNLSYHQVIQTVYLF
jgi:hypothetical protein